MMHDLTYFKKENKESPGMCAADYTNRPHKIHINLIHVVSVTPPTMFYLPLSGGPVGKVSKVTMVTREMYYIQEVDYNHLMVKMRANAHQ